MRLAIDRHRKIRSRPLRRQRSGRPDRKVDHGDLTRVRHIHKDLGPGFVDLKPLRMRFEPDIRGLRQGCRIDHRQRTLAVTHQHSVARGVYPHIVGIVTELDAPDRGQILAPQHAHRAVTGIRHKYAVGKRDIRNALRLAQTGDPAQHLARRQIDHAEAVVAELGNKQPLPLHIDAEVIDAAAHFTERDLRLEHERRAAVCATSAAGHIRLAARQDRPCQHAQLFAILICASAAFSPSASFFASSLAQKCMK